MEPLRLQTPRSGSQVASGFSGNSTAELALVASCKIRQLSPLHGNISSTSKANASQPETCNWNDASFQLAPVYEPLRPEMPKPEAEDISNMISIPHSLFVKEGRNPRGFRAQPLVQPMFQECSPTPMRQFSRATSLRGVSLSMRTSSRALGSPPCHAWLPEGTHPRQPLARLGSERPFLEGALGAALPKSSSARDLEPHMCNLRPLQNLTLTSSFVAPDPRGAKCSAGLRVTRRTLAELDVMSAALASTSGSGFVAETLPALRAMRALAPSDSFGEQREVASVLCPRTDAVACLQPVDLTAVELGPDKAAASGASIHPSCDGRVSTQLCSRTDAVANLKQAPNGQRPTRLHVTLVQHIGPKSIALEDWDDGQRPGVRLYRPDRPATPHPDRRRQVTSSERLEGGDEDVEFSDQAEVTAEEGYATVLNPLAAGSWAARNSSPKRDSLRCLTFPRAAISPLSRRSTISCGTLGNDRRGWEGPDNDGQPVMLARPDEHSRCVLHDLRATVGRLGCGLWPSSS